jgi:tripartite-type tricarboxylate transporter receptor subunit TctC
MTRTRLLRTACAIFALVASFAAAAQEYPNRAVRIIVPFAAGGSADVFGRILAQHLQESLGQSFVVEDRPGAGAVIGTDAVAKSAPDGYTLLVMSNTHTVNESLLQNKPYQLVRDFVPVAPINFADLVLVARPGLPAASLADVIKLAKAKPGSLTYASSGPGTPYHMAGELFKAMAGVNILHVPYKGSAGARTDLLGGQVDLMFDAIATMTEHIKAGKVKALATTGRARSTTLPDVPTVAEAGLPGFEASSWFGLLAPAGTPPAVIAKVNGEVRAWLATPEAKAKLLAQGANPAGGAPEDFAKHIAAETAKWQKVVKESGAKID